MATADQVKALVKSHAEGDDERFYAVALQVAARAARSGHSGMAQELRDLVDSLRSRPASRSAARRPTLVVQPSGRAGRSARGDLPRDDIGRSCP